MTQDYGHPEGTPWLSPYLTVSNVQSALDFYERTFGFTTRYAKEDPDGTIFHASMDWHESIVMLGAEGAYGGTSKTPAASGVESPVSLVVYCEDVDALFNRAVAAGASVGFAPMDMFWGDRMCKLIDPDGHAWHFATKIEDETEP